VTSVPEPIAEFLRGKRIAVAGVTRDAGQPANAIYRKLRDSGYEALPINPNAAEIEGARCSPGLASAVGAVTSRASGRSLLRRAEARRSR
jgi:hypothetical protein